MKLWVSSPLSNKKEIEERLDAIEDLNNFKELCDSFRKELEKLSDLENILLRLYSYQIKHKGR
jgi:DNA mismatch repair ATPase MutS